MSVGARRLAALVVAIALIGLAVLLRGFVEDDEENGSASGDGGPVQLLCATEVAAACEELAEDNDLNVEIEQAGVSVDEIATVPDDRLRDLGFDGWLTFSRDAEIVAQRRERAALAPALGAPSDRIARSPLVIGVIRDRAAALDRVCPDGVTWRCIGDHAGQEWAEAGGDPAWGRVKPGHADPATTGEGLLVIGQAATSFFDGRTDLSIDDYESDAFLEWFSRLEDAVRPVPFDGLFRAGLVDMVGSLEATAGPSLENASRDSREQVRLLYPAPVATADVVFVPAVGADGADGLADVVTGDEGRAALARAGWRVEGEPRAPGVPDSPPLPAGDELPDAGSLQALLATWREVTG